MNVTNLSTKVTAETILAEAKKEVTEQKAKDAKGKLKAHLSQGIWLYLFFKSVL